MKNALKCGLTTLQTRWLRGNKIEILRLNGYKNIDRNIFLSRKIVKPEDTRCNL